MKEEANFVCIYFLNTFLMITMMNRKIDKDLCERERDLSESVCVGVDHYTDSTIIHINFLLHDDELE
jgi:hypothetical protein